MATLPLPKTRSFPLRPSTGRPDTDRSLFWLPVLTLALCWIIVPAKIAPNFRPETLETLAVGQNWHPALLGHGALACVLGDTFYTALRRAPWVPYFVAQLCVVFSLFIYHSLAKRFLPERSAFAAAMAMLSFCFFNVDSTLLCGTIMLPIFWLGTIFFYHRALTEGKLVDWGRTGLILGLGMYTSPPAIGRLVLAILVYQLFPKPARMKLSTERFFPGPLLAAAIFALVAAPVVVWGYQHNGAGLFFPREFSLPGPVNSIHRYLGVLGIIALLILLPVIPMSTPTLFKSKYAYLEDKEHGKANYLFLNAMFGIPFVTLVGQALGRHHYEILQVAPIFYLLPIFFLFCCQKKDPSPARQWTSMVLAIVIPILILAASALAVMYYPARTGKPLSCHFPGQSIAWAVRNHWHSHGSLTPLPFVRGEERLANNASIYAPDRSRVWNQEWASEDDFARQGGIWLWDDNDPEKEQIIATIKERYPQAIFSASFLVPYRTKAKVPPLHISMAVIPPRGGFLPPGIVTHQ